MTKMSPDGAALAFPVDVPVALSTPVAGIVLERLHGDRCIRDGCPETSGLAPAGWAYTVGADGTRMGWPVRACPDHQQEEPS